MAAIHLTVEEHEVQAPYPFLTSLANNQINLTRAKNRRIFGDAVLEAGVLRLY